MPRQAPVFRARGARERKPWQLQAGATDKRKRGRAGQRDRAEVLAEEPLCRLCRAKGLTVASDVVDHILCLSWGGRDDRANKQGLCNPCHDAKSAAERAEDRASRTD